MISQQNGNRTIGPGAILFEKSALLPEPLRLEADAAESGWARVANNLDGHQLEKALATEGWTFFYMAGRIRTTAFGFDREKMVHTALKRLIAKVRLQKCNCLEIDEVAAKSFLGMPYVSVSGHSRHIKKGLVFNDIPEKPGVTIRAKEPQSCGEQDDRYAEPSRVGRADQATG
jgi:hypothetical protein